MNVTRIATRTRPEHSLGQWTGELAQLTLDAIGSGVITTGVDGRVRYLNDAAESMLGCSLAEMRGLPWSTLITLMDESSGGAIEDPISRSISAGSQIRLSSHAVILREDGERVGVEGSVAPICDCDAKVIGAALVFQDVTRTRKLVRRISYEATHDGLTRLVNRKEFERRLQRLLEHESPAQHALLYMDMDGFKLVNDTGGHAAGDAVLREVAAVFRSRVRERDTLARLGGDEFGLILEHCPQSQALGAAYQLRKAIEDHEFRWDGRVYRVGVSIGFVPISGSNWKLDDLLAAADSACYEAKRIGRDHIQPAHNPATQRSRRRGELRWSQSLNEALSQDRFWLHCQPIAPLSATDPGPSRYEILVRMIGLDGSMIEPQTFVPVAERLGIMPRIDRWVIRNAFSTVLKGSKHQNGPRYAINLSGTSLNDTGLMEFIREQLRSFEVDPCSVCFEITETAVIHNLARTAHLMRELKDLNFSFALDDFGSGLSSFGYLKALPVDYLKIDGSFVRNMEDDSVDYAMVKCINEIGHVMGIKTVAEFVHSKAVWDKLKSLHVDYAQGDIVGSPRPLLATA